MDYLDPESVRKREETEAFKRDHPWVYHALTLGIILVLGFLAIIASVLAIRAAWAIIEWLW